MGSCSYSTPDYQNYCSSAIGDRQTLPGSCQSPFFTGDQCVNISPQEWQQVDTTNFGSCGYNDCAGDFSGGYDGGFGLCCDNGCCVLEGQQAICGRFAFTGSPLDCCFQDYACNGGTNPALCWSDSAQKQTCDPQYRNITTTSCQNTLINYCLGNDLTADDSSWLQRWNNTVTLPDNGYSITQPCLYLVNRNLYNTPSTPQICNNFQIPNLPVSATGFTYVQNLLTRAYEKYTAQGFVLGVNPGTAGFNQWQNTLLGICQHTPGVCSSILYSAATGLTAEKLLELPVSAQIFGCYLPDAEYAAYIDQYQIPKQCTPTCNRSNVIPALAPDGVTSLACENNICLMDNIAVNLINSQIGGNINFSQVCGGCSSTTPGVNASCTCIVSGTTLDVINSSLGGQINFQQQCTGTIQCITQDSSGNKIQVPCGSSNNPLSGQTDQMAAAAAISRNEGNILLIVLLIVLVVIIIVVLVVYHARKL